MDDYFCSMQQHPTPRRLGLRSSTRIAQTDPATAFNDALNSMHQHVKFTCEDEKDNCLAFLDVQLTRLDNGRITTRVYRKPTNTNVLIKPQSCQHPQVTISSFKGELCRAYRLSCSPSIAQEEIGTILDLYEDNGHDRRKLAAIAEQYLPPPNSSATTARNNQHSTSQQSDEDITAMLFTHLPLTLDDPDSADDETPASQDLSGAEVAAIEKKLLVCLPYIPGVSNQLKRILQKAGCKSYFKSGTMLKNVLCGKNKSHQPPTEKKGVYKITCPFALSSAYIGQMSRKFSIQMKEHKKATNQGK
jgi:hypothetical protein